MRCSSSRAAEPRWANRQVARGEAIRHFKEPSEAATNREGWARVSKGTDGYGGVEEGEARSSDDKDGAVDAARRPAEVELDETRGARGRALVRLDRAQLVLALVLVLQLPRRAGDRAASLLLRRLRLLLRLASR